MGPQVKWYLRPINLAMLWVHLEHELHTSLDVNRHLGQHLFCFVIIVLGKLHLDLLYGFCPCVDCPLTLIYHHTSPWDCRLKGKMHHYNVCLIYH